MNIDSTAYFRKFESVKLRNFTCDGLILTECDGLEALIWNDRPDDKGNWTVRLNKDQKLPDELKQTAQTKGEILVKVPSKNIATLVGPSSVLQFATYSPKTKLLTLKF